MIFSNFLDCLKKKKNSTSVFILLLTLNSQNSSTDLEQPQFFFWPPKQPKFSLPQLSSKNFKK